MDIRAGAVQRIFGCGISGKASLACTIVSYLERREGNGRVGSGRAHRLPESGGAKSKENAEIAIQRRISAKSGGTILVKGDPYVAGGAVFY